jgi:hypothetical protein
MLGGAAGGGRNRCGLQREPDGERTLVTNLGGSSVTVFRAADLSFIANVSTGGTFPTAACSDGINFRVSNQAAGMLRF